MSYAVASGPWGPHYPREFMHPTSRGTVSVMCYYDEHGMAAWLEVVQADPEILVGGRFLREIHAGQSHLRLPFAEVTRVAPGGVFRILTRPAPLVYVLTAFEPEEGGHRIPDVWVARFPD